MLGAYQTPGGSEFNIFHGIPFETIQATRAHALRRSNQRRDAGGDGGEGNGQGGGRGEDGADGGRDGGSEASGGAARTRRVKGRRQSGSSSAAGPSTGTRASDWDSSPPKISDGTSNPPWYAPKKPSNTSLTGQRTAAVETPNTNDPNGSFSQDLMNPFLDDELQVPDAFLQDMGGETVLRLSAAPGTM